MAVAQPALSLTAMPAPTARVSVVFDVDRTLLPGSSVAIFGRLLSEAGLVRRRAIARQSLREAVFAARGLSSSSLERLCHHAVAEATGHDQTEVLDIAARAARVVEGRMFPAARWLLRQHVDRGDRVILLSAGPQELVAAVAGLVGADGGLGTVAEVADGCYTGRLTGPFCHGTGKVERLRSLLDEREIAACTAYGDSLSDLPVLRASADPVAANPDRALTAVADASRWPILRFR